MWLCSLKELNLYFKIMNVKLCLLNQEMLRRWGLSHSRKNCWKKMKEKGPPPLRGEGVKAREARYNIASFSGGRL